MKTKLLFLTILLIALSLTHNGFSQSNPSTMEPPAITKLDYLGQKYYSSYFDNLRASYQVLMDNSSNKVLLSSSFNLGSNSSGNPEGHVNSYLISLDNKSFTKGYSFYKVSSSVYSNAKLLKTENEFLFFPHLASETDSCLILDESLELKRKVKLKTIGLVDAKIVGDNIFTVTNDSEIDKTVVSIYSTDFDFLQKFEISGQTSQVFTADGNLIAVSTNSINIISNALELKQLSLPATSWIQKEDMILGINPEANSWLLNTNSLEKIELGEGQKEAFWSSNGYFLVSENSISKYDENNSEEYNFLISEEAGFNKPSIQFNNDFFLLSYSSTTPLNNEKRYKLLNSQGEQIFSEEAIIYTNNPFTPSLSKFNSGDMLLNSPAGLRKINNQGELVWEKVFSGRNNASVFINADDSFTMLLDHDSYDVLAQFENDDERCRYQAINPVPETLCLAEEANGYHQSIVKIDGNLPATTWYVKRNVYSLLQPYHGLGIDFLWYRDGMVDSSQFKVNSTYKDSTNYFIDLVPNSTYKVEVKQGNCALMSEDILFKGGDNNEIMEPSINAEPEVIFIGDTVKITVSCENSYFSGSYQRPSPYPENFKLEMPLNDTTYSIGCESRFQRINANYLEESGVHYFSPGDGTCISNSVSANVIVYDPSTVLATENETISIKIYPNPAHNYLDIKTPQNLELKGMDVLNANGKLIQSVKAADRIKLEGYIPGIYHLRLKFFDHVATRKFVIN